MNKSDANITFGSNYADWEYEQNVYFYGLSALFACNLFIGLPANIYVMYQIVGGGSGAVVAEFFALNLAVGEVLLCILCLCTLIHSLLKLNEHIVYTLVYLLMQLMLVSRPVFQGWICLERYLAVVHPTVFLRLKPLRYRLPCCTVTWVLILLDSIACPLLLKYIITLYLLMSKCIFLLLLMMYCGVHALCVLIKPRPGDGIREQESQNGMKRKAFKIIMITLTFSIMTLSIKLFILAPVLMYGSFHAVIRVILFCMSVSILSGFIPPLLYLYRAGKLPCIKF